jgi:hypothetical protein
VPAASGVVVQYGDDPVRYARRVEGADGAQYRAGSAFWFALIVQEADQVRQVRMQY